MILFILFQLYECIDSKLKNNLIILSLITITILGNVKFESGIFRNLTQASVRLINSPEIILNFFSGHKDLNITPYSSGDLFTKGQAIENKVEIIDYNVPIEGRLIVDKLSDNTYIGLHETNKLLLFTIIAIILFAIRAILKLKTNKKEHFTFLITFLISICFIRLHILHLSVVITLYLYLLFNKKFV
jgi:hypothetical protein